jgi:hypothetical protein
MKYARRIIALTLTLLPVLAAAQLRSNDRILAQVPFEFMVANKAVPAGECIVQVAVMDGRTLVIRNTAAKLGLFSQASLDEAKKAAGDYALVFHKYGDQYFLAGIRIAGDRTIYRLQESKAEAELRAQNAPLTEKILLASLK